MRKSTFSEEQIAMALRQHEAGTTLGEICRKLETSDTTFFRWQKQYGGMGVAELRELRQPRDENRTLKTLVYRLYREDGLVLKRRRPTRRKSVVQRTPRPQPAAANERWAMDFVHDTLAGGQTIRVSTVVDVRTRECVALVPQVDSAAQTSRAC